MNNGTLPPTTNRQTWSQSVELIDTETGEPCDLSEATEITLALMDDRIFRTGDYWSAGNAGVYNTTTRLTGRLTTGEISIIDLGVFQWVFSAAQMRALEAKTYAVGCTFERDDVAVQVFIGTVAVLGGVVP